mmetsp:Transcript_83011/g.130565  ORF Transcript_83011/g.130565 Transcript_83011/m.130565 type:complete len:689 (+) Transcript_83011:106-2172(+)
MVAVPLDPEIDAGTYSAAAEILSGRVLGGAQLGDDGKAESRIPLSPEQQPPSPQQLGSASPIPITSPQLNSTSALPASPRPESSVVATSGQCSRADSPITICTTPTPPNRPPLVTRESDVSTETLPPTSSREEGLEAEVASVARFDQMMRLALQKTFGDDVPKHLEARVTKIASTDEVSRQASRRNVPWSPSLTSSPRESSRRPRSSSRRRHGQTSPEPAGRLASPHRALCVGTSSALGSTASPCKSAGSTQVPTAARRRSPPRQQQVRSGAVFTRLFLDSKDRQQRKASEVGEEGVASQDQQRKACDGSEEAPKVQKIPESWKERHQRKTSDSIEEAPALKAHKAPSSSKATADSHLQHLGARCSVLASQISSSINAAPELPAQSSSRASSQENRVAPDPAFPYRLFSQAQEWKARRMQLIEEHNAVEQERLKREAAQALKGTASRQRHAKRYPSPPRQVGFIEKLLKYKSDADAIACAQEQRLTQEGRSTSQARPRTDISCENASDADITSTATTILSGCSPATSSNDVNSYQVIRQKDSLQQADALSRWDSVSSPSTLVEDKSRRDIVSMKRQLGLLLLSVDVLKRRVDQYEASQPSSDHHVGRLGQAGVREAEDTESLKRILVGTMAGMDAAAKATSAATQFLTARDVPTCEVDAKADYQCDDFELQEKVGTRDRDALNHAEAS